MDAKTARDLLDGCLNRLSLEINEDEFKSLAYYSFQYLNIFINCQSKRMGY